MYCGLFGQKVGQYVLDANEISRSGGILWTIRLGYGAIIGASEPLRRS